MNLPNKLTLIRVLLIPVFIVFVQFVNLPYAKAIALAVFCIASFTDFLDGYIARKNNLVTDFGKFMDPLADKLLTTVALIYMCVDGICSPIALILILAREFAVSGVRMVAASSGGEVIAANIWGKVKTVLQMVTIIFYYLMVSLQNLNVAFVNSYTPQIISYVLIWVVCLVTVASGCQYLWQNRDYIKNAK